MMVAAIHSTVLLRRNSVAQISQVLLSTAYLPPIQHFAWFTNKIPVFIEQHENYLKQTYRNRCTILSANEPLNLTIPTIKKSGEKVSIRDVEIDYSTPWQKNHWKALESAYQSSPYFEHLADDLAPAYNEKTKYLFDLNLALMEALFSFIEITPKLKFTSNYITQTGDDTVDLRELISPKADSDNNWFTPKQYYQVFGHKSNFIPNLSVIDLICNEGLLSVEILENCINKNAHRS